MALDCAVDPTTPTGEAMANVLATIRAVRAALDRPRTREGAGAEKGSGRAARPSERATYSGPVTDQAPPACRQVVRRDRRGAEPRRRCDCARRGTLVRLDRACGPGVCRLTTNPSTKAALVRYG